MKYHWRPVIAGTFIMLATYVLFYLMTAFTLTYGTAPATVEAARAAAEAKGKVFDAAAEAAFAPGLGIARPEFLTMLIIGVVFFGIFTLVSGPLAEKFGRRKSLICGHRRHPALRPRLDPDVRRRARALPWPA